MNKLKIDDFLKVAHERSIIQGPCSDDGTPLAFSKASSNEIIWEYDGNIPHILSVFAASLAWSGDWHSLFAYPCSIHWPAPPSFSAVAGIYDHLMAALAVPLGEACVLEFTRDEINRALSLAFLNITMAPYVLKDICFVPDTGSCIFLLHHHQSVAVSFRTRELGVSYLEYLNQKGIEAPDYLDLESYRRQQ